MPDLSFQIKWQYVPRIHLKYISAEIVLFYLLPFDIFIDKLFNCIIYIGNITLLVYNNCVFISVKK